VDILYVAFIGDNILCTVHNFNMSWVFESNVTQVPWGDFSSACFTVAFRFVNSENACNIV
jgi:hypothetical protein